MPSKIMGKLSDWQSNIKCRYYRLVDPASRQNLHTIPVIPRGLEKNGLIDKTRPLRILEIGPKFGQAARDMDKRFNVEEIVFLDLPEQKPVMDLWLAEIKAPHSVIYANLMHLTKEEIKEIGRFDLVYCAGVIYHIAEQLRLCKVLFDLTSDNGLVVIESFIEKTKKPIVKICPSHKLC